MDSGGVRQEKSRCPCFLEKKRWQSLRAEKSADGPLPRLVGSLASWGREEDFRRSPPKTSLRRNPGRWLFWVEGRQSGLAGFVRHGARGAGMVSRCRGSFLRCQDARVRMLRPFKRPQAGEPHTLGDFRGCPWGGATAEGSRQRIAGGKTSRGVEELRGNRPFRSTLSCYLKKPQKVTKAVDAASVQLRTATAGMVQHAAPSGRDFRSTNNSATAADGNRPCTGNRRPLEISLGGAGAPRTGQTCQTAGMDQSAVGGWTFLGLWVLLSGPRGFQINPGTGASSGRWISIHRPQPAVCWDSLTNSWFQPA